MYVSRSSFRVKRRKLGNLETVEEEEIEGEALFLQTYFAVCHFFLLY